MPRGSHLESFLRLPPRWVIILALAVDLGFTAWRSAGTGTAPQPSFFLHSLFWPGSAIFAAVYVVAWLGWSLDID